MSPFDVAVAGIVFGTTSATIISLAKLRMRANQQRYRVSDPPLEDRLERIEQAVDAIALEVERMAESQRFTTRLLTERLPTPEALPSADRGRT
jgi:hypothetical protein